jgi:hypothetical protein
VIDWKYSLDEGKKDCTQNFGRETLENVGNEVLTAVTGL